MRFLIILGFFLGFGGVLTAAVFAPYGAQERVRSRTTVENNGGRLETFIVRLPADRIVSTSAGISGPLATETARSVAAPPGLEGTQFAVEQFKLRNVDGDVVGLATRHWTRVDGAGVSTWAVSLPGRGSLVWSQEGDTPTQLTNTLASVGVQAGTAWHGEFDFDATASGSNGRVIAGTEEFENTSGFVEEIWSVSGVSSDGELSGTITLNSVVNQTS